MEGIPELPRDLTTQSLRFLYRILFLLFAKPDPNSESFLSARPSMDPAMASIGSRDHPSAAYRFIS